VEETAAIFKKVSDTCLQRYGKSRASATTAIIEKTKNTNIKKYGRSSYNGSDQQRNHSLEKYGVDHPSKSSIVSETRSKTCLARYGASSTFGSPMVREKSKQTNLNRYGNTDHMQNTDIKKKMINSCLENGKYFRLEDKSDWYIYNTLSHFSNGFSDFIRSEEDRLLIATHGIYNAVNKSGLVRDHIYSRRDGYVKNVFYEILKHPANCQLIPHKDNCSKKSKSNISLNELFDRIRGYKFSYHDHDVVIQLIDRYTLGERFDIEKFKSIIGG
jgi:virulence-associated protein VapD